MSTFKNVFKGSNEIIAYGYCVKAELYQVKGRVEFYEIEQEFVEYWGIPKKMFKLAEMPKFMNIFDSTGGELAVEYNDDTEMYHYKGDKNYCGFSYVECLARE